MPADVLEKERDIQRARASDEGKPEKMVDKIVEGRMSKFYEEICLLEQPFIRENTISVARVDQDSRHETRRYALRSPASSLKVGDAGDAPGVAREPAACNGLNLKRTLSTESVMARDGHRTNRCHNTNAFFLKSAARRWRVSSRFGLDPDRVKSLAGEVAEVARTGVQIGLVLGGGNIFRGVAAAAHQMDRVTGDHMGMLATVINALAFQDALEQQGMPTRVMTAIQMHQVAEPYIRRRAIRHLEKGRVVIFAAGTSNPYFSTDTAATLRGLEIHARDHRQGDQCRWRLRQRSEEIPGRQCKYAEVSYTEVLSKALGVMDASAVAMCRDNQDADHGFRSEDRRAI